MSDHELPPAPAASFASDNAAGASPEVIEALAAANAGPALAYGDDPWTADAVAAIRERFDAPVEVLFAWGGTGANIVGLTTLLQPWQSVIAVDSAHVIVDEAGGPARFSGSTFTTVANVDGKLVPDAIEPFVGWLGEEHHPQPAVATISQVTESGTVYTVDEIGALADRCHAHGMLLHLDGARIANALVASGSTLVEMVRDTGVDAMTFGFTKNGAVFGEAVVYLRPELAGHARFVRKQAGQLVSKSRFVGAQVSALLRDDLWLRNARTANDRAAELAGAVGELAAVEVVRPPEANAVFARIPWDRLGELQRWSFFWPWDPADAQVRWMASFATTSDDVATFAAGLRRLLG
ncbi:MAG: beta-eliminating lyase-related protein [Acidimicrobiales bacterium]